MCYVMKTSFKMISYKNNEPSKSHANDFHESHGPTLKGFTKEFYRSRQSTLLQRFLFSKEWAYRFSEGFLGSNLKTEALVHKQNTSERESLQSLRSVPAHEVEGLQGLLNVLFLESKRIGRNRRTEF